jgi:hypothetical protein
VQAPDNPFANPFEDDEPAFPSAAPPRQQQGPRDPFDEKLTRKAAPAAAGKAAGGRRPQQVRVYARCSGSHGWLLAWVAAAAVSACYVRGDIYALTCSKIHDADGAIEQQQDSKQGSMHLFGLLPFYKQDPEEEDSEEEAAMLAAAASQRYPPAAGAAGNKQVRSSGQRVQ